MFYALGLPVKRIQPWHCCYFNWPNIDWSTWTSTSKTGYEIKFIDTLRKNFLNQYVSKPTRARGDDHPHILDLVITNCDNYRVSGALEKLEHETILQDRASDR